jgi:hypothetical protein
VVVVLSGWVLLRLRIVATLRHGLLLHVRHRILHVLHVLHMLHVLLHVEGRVGRRRATRFLRRTRVSVRHARDPVRGTRIASKALGPRACGRRWTTSPRSLDKRWPMCGVGGGLPGVGRRRRRVGIGVGAVGDQIRRDVADVVGRHGRWHLRTAVLAATVWQLDVGPAGEPIGVIAFLGSLGESRAALSSRALRRRGYRGGARWLLSRAALVAVLPLSSTGRFPGLGCWTLGDGRCSGGVKSRRVSRRAWSRISAALGRGCVARIP